MSGRETDTQGGSVVLQMARWTLEVRRIHGRRQWADTGGRKGHEGAETSGGAQETDTSREGSGCAAQAREAHTVSGGDHRSHNEPTWGVHGGTQEADTLMSTW